MHSFNCTAQVTDTATISTRWMQRLESTCHNECTVLNSVSNNNNLRLCEVEMKWMMMTTTMMKWIIRWGVIYNWTAPAWCNWTYFYAIFSRLHTVTHIETASVCFVFNDLAIAVHWTAVSCVAMNSTVIIVPFLAIFSWTVMLSKNWVGLWWQCW